MPLLIACPNCHQQLKIPEPIPDLMRCGKCGKLFKKAPTQPSPVSASAPQSVKPAPPVPPARPAPSAPPPAAVIVPPSSAAIREARPAVIPDNIPNPPKPVPVKANGPKGVPVAAFAPSPRSNVPVQRERKKTGLVLIGLGAVAALLIIAVLLIKPFGEGRGTSGKEGSVSSEEEKNAAIGLNLEKTPRTIAASRPQWTRTPRCEEAIKKGVAFLRTRVPPKDNPDNRHLGELALLGLTLLECEVPARDDDVQRIADIIRANSSNMLQTYTAAPALLFLDRLSRDKKKPSNEDYKLMRTLGLRLIAGQTESQNLWGYEIPLLDDAGEYKLLGKLRNREFVASRQSEADMSNTQFAALALWRAGAHDIPVEDPLRKAAASIRRFQSSKNGTWPYSVVKDVSFRDTGTCVGLILLALGQSFEPKGAAKFFDDPAVIKALNHLADIIKNPKNKVEPGKSTKEELKLGKRFDAGSDLYFLWTLERTALILNRTKIGDQDWYAWGSEFIFANQNEDGSWREIDEWKGVPETCFALLFLARANLFSDLTDKLELSLENPLEGLELPGPSDEKTRP